MHLVQYLYKLINKNFRDIIFSLSIKSYEGGCENGNYHGKGRLVFKNGSVYEGEFKNNKMDGYGKIFFNDGSIYQGNFRDNLKNGTGLFKSTDGKLERVIYKEGRFKEIFKEDFTINWECTIQGDFHVKCKSGDATKIFKSFPLEKILEKSDFSLKGKKFKIIDISVV